LTGIGNNFAGASALWTGRNHLEETAAPGDLAAAAAGSTSTWFCSFGRAAAVAILAPILPGKFDRFLRPFGNVI
jgi:hypothetical protein